MHQTEEQLQRQDKDIERQALRVAAARETARQYAKRGSPMLLSRAWRVFREEMKKLVALSRREN